MRARHFIHERGPRWARGHVFPYILEVFRIVFAIFTIQLEFVRRKLKFKKNL